MVSDFWPPELREKTFLRKLACSWSFVHTVRTAEGIKAVPLHSPAGSHSGQRGHGPEVPRPLQACSGQFVQKQQNHAVLVTFWYPQFAERFTLVHNFKSLSPCVITNSKAGTAWHRNTTKETQRTAWRPESRVFILCSFPSSSSACIQEYALLHLTLVIYLKKETSCCVSSAWLMELCQAKQLIHSSDLQRSRLSAPACKDA